MSDNVRKVFKMFSLMWILTGIGVIIGSFMPFSLVIPIAVVVLILLIGMWFTRNNKRLSTILVYIIATMTGVVLYAAMNFYLGVLGTHIVIQVVGTCVITFTALGYIGYKLERDLRSWGTILLILLFGLVIFSIITLFIGVSDLVMVITSGIGVIIFLAYTIYDFNQISKQVIDDSDIPIVTLNLYLNLVNLILQALKLTYYLKQLLDE